MLDRIIAEDRQKIASFRPESWQELRNQKIFMTGGTGFFGKWFVESFLEINKTHQLGAQIWILSRNPEAFRSAHSSLTSDSSIRLVQGSIETFEFPQEKFSYLIHGATSTDTALADREPLLVYDSITLGTRRALEFAKQAGVKKFLLLSSGAVYGKQPEDLPQLPETYSGSPDPLDHRSCYGIGKKAAEHLGHLYQHLYGIEVKTARCFATVGPYLPLDTCFAVGNFIQNGINCESIQIQGDGTPTRSYLYTSDLMIWLWQILLHGKGGEAYNVGSEDSHSIFDVAQSLGKFFNTEVQIQGKPEAGKSRQNYIPSCQKARQELGLQVTLSFEEALFRTATWYQNRWKNP